MKRGLVVVICLSLIIILSLSFVSAGFFGDLWNKITGKTVTGKVISNEGLVAQWEFDGNAQDSSGNGNNGVIFNGATWTTGKFGGAFQFDGVDDYVSIVNNSGSLNLDNSFTLTAWISSAGSSAEQGIIYKINPSPTWVGYHFDLMSGSNDMKLRCMAHNTTSVSGNAISSSALTKNQWHFVACVRDTASGKISLYVDGIQAATPTTDNSAGKNIINSVPLNIGSSFNNAKYFNGAIDKVKIFSRALSASEIQELYNEGEVINQTCAEDWVCTDWGNCNSGQQIRTCTDANNCGTINNKPLEIQNCTSTTTNCTDSDGGINYYVSGRSEGRVNGSDINAGEWCGLVGVGGGVVSSCSGANCTLSESYCYDSQTIKEITYNCPYGCSDGACLQQTNQTITCSDDMDCPSTTITYCNNNSEACSSTTSYSCQNPGTTSSKCVVAGGGGGCGFCPNGCSDGACVEKECTPKYSCEISPLICPSAGIQTKECKDVECNNPDYTEEVICNPGECGGCEFDNKCIPYGFRTTIELFNNEPGKYNVYCDIDGKIYEQKTLDYQGNWATCQNNYECESNVCSSGDCIEVKSIIEEASGFKSIFVRVLCKLAHSFNEDNYETCIINFLG